MLCTDVKLSPPSAAEKHICIFLSSANWKGKKKKGKKTIRKRRWKPFFFSSNQDKSTHFVAWTHSKNSSVLKVPKISSSHLFIEQANSPGGDW